jgi:hypothetical protein
LGDHAEALTDLLVHDLQRASIKFCGNCRERGVPSACLNV